MATQTITKVTCDLTGRTIVDDKKAPITQTLEVGGEHKVSVTITIPEGIDVDQDALLRAIGNAAAKMPRTVKSTEPAATSTGRNGRKKPETATEPEPASAA